MIWILEIVPVYHIKNSGNTGVEISYFVTIQSPKIA